MQQPAVDPSAANRPVRYVRVREDSSERIPVPVCLNRGQLFTRPGHYRVGRMNLEPSETDFRFSGIPAEHVIVFHRSLVQVRHLGRRPFLAGPNTATLLDPEQIYYREPVAGQRLEALWVTIDAALLDDLKSDNGGSGEIQWPGPWLFVTGRCYLAQYALRRAALSGVTNAQLLDRAAQALIRRIVEGAVQAGDEEVSADNLELLNRARLEIAEDPSSDQSMEDLAEQLGCSYSRLYRVFRQALGTSPHQYRIQTRLRAALRALEDEDCNLVELAENLGFANQSHLSSTFRRELGVTPSKIRRSKPAVLLEAALEALAEE